MGASADIAATGRMMPAVTRPPRRRLPTASTQSPTRGLCRPPDIRKVAAAIDLDQRDVGARIGADHLGGVSLAVIGGHLDGLRLIDHVVVGHRIAVGADEEPGALAGHQMLARSAPFLGGGPFRQAEATEETLDVRRKRRIALEAHHLWTARELDANGNDGGLHLLDDIGKSHRALGALGIRDRTERRAGLEENPRTAEQHGHAETGNAGEQNETTRGEGARFRSGNARSHEVTPSFCAAGGRAAPREQTRWRSLPYRALSGKLKVGKVDGAKKA